MYEQMKKLGMEKETAGSEAELKTEGHPWKT